MTHDLTYYLAYYLVVVPVACLMAWPIIGWTCKRQSREREERLMDACMRACAAGIAEDRRQRPYRSEEDKD